MGDKLVEYQNEIMKEIGNYYKNLYSSKNIADLENETYLNEAKNLYQ